MIKCVSKRNCTSNRNWAFLVVAYNDGHEYSIIGRGIYLAIVNTESPSTFFPTHFGDTQEADFYGHSYFGPTRRKMYGLFR